jgi:DNA-binding IclR family transcriptional regulator
VEWIGRLGAAGATDVMARFGMGRTAAYRRLAALVDQGVLATERLLYVTQPGEPQPGRSVSSPWSSV